MLLLRKIALVSIVLAFTVVGCSDRQTGSEGSTCTWQGKTYQDQEEWYDGCNRCKCNAEGSAGAVCTQRACPEAGFDALPDAPPSDAGADTIPGDALTFDQGPPVTCGAPTNTADAQAVVAQIDALGWNWVGPYTSTLLEVSDDVAVTGKLTIAGSAVKVPPECLNRTDCRHQVAFLLSKTVPGVSCSKPDQVGWLSACAEVTIDDVSVRFRATFHDTHPGEWNFVPMIEIIPDCNAPCAAGELRCNANNTCIASYERFCQLCLAKDKQVCPCMTASGPKEDKTECHFMVSGDVMCQGECKAGLCEYTGTPGWAGCP